MKKKIGVIVFFLILIATVFLLGKQFLPQLNEEEEVASYVEFVTVEEMHVTKTNETYIAKAKVTIPDMSKYVSEFASSGVFGKNAKWKDIEEKIATEFVKFLKKQKELETEDYELELDLFPYMEDYKMSLEYWTTQGAMEDSNFEFSEEQIQNILMKEAIFQNLKDMGKE